MQRKIITLTITIVLLLGLIAVPAQADDNSHTYTLDADFDEGVLFNVNHDSPNNDQLQLNEESGTYPIMWIANAGEDTVSKFDTSTNKELARYHTWFGTGTHGAWTGPAPSRTAVDAEGNCYVANRQFSNSIAADVIKIYADDWTDRNGNGVMDTSYDANNNGTIESSETLTMTDVNSNNIIDDSEIQDERIAWAVKVGPNNGIARALAIAPDGNIWVGLFQTRQYYEIDSDDGSVVSGPYSVGNTPYGAMIDKYGILWGASLGTTLLRLDTSDGSSLVLSHHTPGYYYGNNYAIALGYDADGYTQVYLSSTNGHSYIQYNTKTSTFSIPATTGFVSRGVGVDPAGNIYCSDATNNGGLAKFAPDGTTLWQKPTQSNSDSRAAVVDSDGNVWVVLLGVSKVAKYDGATGSSLGTFPTGYLPYTYSDATGIGLRGSIKPQGTWTAVYDSGDASAGWGTVSWNSEEPQGTEITVKVRSSIDQTAWSSWEDTTNGGSLTSTPDGQYLQVQVTFRIIDGETSPILYDLTVQHIPSNQPPVAVIDVEEEYTVPLPVTMKVTPQTLNLERLGNWVKVHLHDDTENTPQEMEVTLDGSHSSDPDEDPITFDWTLIGPEGEITIDDSVNPSVVLTAGTYNVTLVVNDGTVDSETATVSFTLTNQTLADLLAAYPGDYYLNDVPGSEVKGDDNVVISFADDAIAATVDVGLDVEMTLTGAASGVDYIDVIQDKENGNGKGKSELKGKGK
ncbi:hypothetical protein ACFLWS_05080 [Chloroflexota bacterium]